ncbi:MAG: 3-deoxy-D-manno-octulosonic acid transferase [Candidatus Omnitrophota bacterium]|nr:3-deoxy-D-manno-octulosonic acid transferase [Candidatus Omnitrophota bacterium]
MLYDLFFIIFSFLYLPYFLIKGKWRSFSRQRFGVFPIEVLSGLKDSRPIWIHAVSVGEVMASVPLFEEITKNYPGEKIVVSTVTSTGNRVARDKFNGRAVVIYLPLDISFIVNKVVKIINPKAVLIAETEIWPNFIKSLNSHGAKVVLFNGRLSRDSFKGYRMIAPFLRGVLRKIDLFLMQSKPDADKIVSLGAPADKVKVTGNLKYDAAFTTGKKDASDAAELRRGFGLSREEQLFIAGSTHPGEEEIILHSYKALMKEYPALRLLIAPRHIERAGDLANLCKAHGFNCRLVSRLEKTDQPLKQIEVLILDIMGILSEVYSAGDVIFIGGSLINKGGQNPLEAAYHSKAILFGPHTHNFEGITEELLAAGAAVRVREESELTDKVKYLLEDADNRRQMGERGRRLLESNIGVARHDLELIKPLLV